MKPDLILIGGGGHCKACIDVIEMQAGYRIVGILDTAAKVGRSVLGHAIIGTDDDLKALVSKRCQILITLGQIPSPERRIALYQKAKQLGAELPIIISPLAHVSRHAQIGEGSVVMHQALVNAGAVVGCNCIINNKALVEHDSVVGDHCHIATGAIVNGGVKVGDETFVGSGSVLRENITIGSGRVLSAGQRFMTDVD